MLKFKKYRYRVRRFAHSPVRWKNFLTVTLLFLTVGEIAPIFLTVMLKIFTVRELVFVYTLLEDLSYGEKF
jgi:hypothetical protein